MEMIDMGKKMDKAVAVAPNEGKDHISYQSLYCDSGKIPPGLEDKEVGSMCRLEIVGKITSKSTDDQRGDGITIEVHKMGYIAKVGGYSKEEKLAMSSEERDKADQDEVLNGEEKPEDKEE